MWFGISEYFFLKDVINIFNELNFISYVDFGFNGIFFIETRGYCSYFQYSNYKWNYLILKFWYIYLKGNLFKHYYYSIEYGQFKGFFLDFINLIIRKKILVKVDLAHIHFTKEILYSNKPIRYLYSFFFFKLNIFFDKLNWDLSKIIFFKILFKWNYHFYDYANYYVWYTDFWSAYLRKFWIKKKLLVVFYTLKVYINLTVSSFLNVIYHFLVTEFFLVLLFLFFLFSIFFNFKHFIIYFYKNFIIFNDKYLYLFFIFNRKKIYKYKYFKFFFEKILKTFFPMYFSLTNEKDKVIYNFTFFNLNKRLDFIYSFFEFSYLYKRKRIKMIQFFNKPEVAFIFFSFIIFYFFKFNIYWVKKIINYFFNFIIFNLMVFFLQNSDIAYIHKYKWQDPDDPDYVPEGINWDKLFYEAEYYYNWANLFKFYPTIYHFVRNIYYIRELLFLTTLEQEIRIERKRAFKKFLKKRRFLKKKFHYLKLFKFFNLKLKGFSFFQKDKHEKFVKKVDFVIKKKKINFKNWIKFLRYKKLRKVNSRRDSDDLNRDFIIDYYITNYHRLYKYREKLNEFIYLLKEGIIAKYSLNIFDKVFKEYEKNKKFSYNYFFHFFFFEILKYFLLNFKNIFFFFEVNFIFILKKLNFFYNIFTLFFYFYFIIFVYILSIYKTRWVFLDYSRFLIKIYLFKKRNLIKNFLNSFYFYIFLKNVLLSLKNNIYFFFWFINYFFKLINLFIFKKIYSLILFFFFNKIILLFWFFLFFTIFLNINSLFIFYSIYVFIINIFLKLSMIFFFNFKLSFIYFWNFFINFEFFNYINFYIEKIINIKILKYKFIFFFDINFSIYENEIYFWLRNNLDKSMHGRFGWVTYYEKVKIVYIDNMNIISIFKWKLRKLLWYGPYFYKTFKNILWYYYHEFLYNNKIFFFNLKFLKYKIIFYFIYLNKWFYMYGYNVFIFNMLKIFILKNLLFFFFKWYTFLYSLFFYLLYYFFKIFYFIYFEILNVFFLNFNKILIFQKLDLNFFKIKFYLILKFLKNRLKFFIYFLILIILDLINIYIYLFLICLKIVLYIFFFFKFYIAIIVEYISIFYFDVVVRFFSFFYNYVPKLSFRLYNVRNLFSFNTIENVFNLYTKLGNNVDLKLWLGIKHRLQLNNFYFFYDKLIRNLFYLKTNYLSLYFLNINSIWAVNMYVYVIFYYICLFLLIYMFLSFFFKSFHNLFKNKKLLFFHSFYSWQRISLQTIDQLSIAEHNEFINEKWKDNWFLLQKSIKLNKYVKNNLDFSNLNLRYKKKEKIFQKFMVFAVTSFGKYKKVTKFYRYLFLYTMLRYDFLREEVRKIYEQAIRGAHNRYNFFENTSFFIPMKYFYYYNKMWGFFGNNIHEFWSEIILKYSDIKYSKFKLYLYSKKEIYNFFLLYYFYIFTNSTQKLDLFYGSGRKYINQLVNVPAFIKKSTFLSDMYISYRANGMRIVSSNSVNIYFDLKFLAKVDKIFDWLSYLDSKYFNNWLNFHLFHFKYDFVKIETAFSKEGLYGAIINLTKDIIFIRMLEWDAFEYDLNRANNFIRSNLQLAYEKRKDGKEGGFFMLKGDPQAIVYTTPLMIIFLIVGYVLFFTLFLGIHEFFSIKKRWLRLFIRKSAFIYVYFLILLKYFSIKYFLYFWFYNKFFWRYWDFLARNIRILRRIKSKKSYRLDFFLYNKIIFEGNLKLREFFYFWFLFLISNMTYFDLICYIWFSDVFFIFLLFLSFIIIMYFLVYIYYDKNLKENFECTYIQDRKINEQISRRKTLFIEDDYYRRIR